jgi:predicted Zn-dependent protease
MSCHQPLFGSGGHAPANECVSCHMPRLQAKNVSHAAVTDHSIPRKPRPGAPDAPAGQVELKAWRAPEAALVRRDLGLAYFERAALTHSAPDLRQAYEILSQLPAEQRKDPPVEADLASVLLQMKEARLAIELFSDAAGQQPGNARYAYVLGAALERTGERERAEKELRRAIQIDPSQVDAYVELAQLYKKTGRNADSRKAIADYLRIMPQDIELRLPH